MKVQSSATKRITDMTTGNPFRLILFFGLPLILGNTLQQVYAMVDTVVLGRFEGVTGLAILGTCSWPIWLSVSFLTNFAQASSLILAKRFGAHQLEELKKATGNIYLIALILGAFLTVVMQLAARPVLVLQNTPAEILNEAVLYLRISFFGIPVLLAYNLYSAFLRSLGDSRTPLNAIMVATVVNIVLDVWFVAGLGWGVAGAAVATVTAQTASAVVCFLRVRSYELLRVEKKHLRLVRSVLSEFFSLSIPMLMQSFAIAFGGVFVQTHINGYGAAFAAGMSASGKVFSLLETACIALAQSTATFVSQNYGAKRFDRIRRGVKNAIWLSLATASLLLISMFAFGRWILGLFVVPEAMETAWGLLRVMSVGLLVAYPMYSIRQAIQALGNAVIPLIAAIVQIFARMLVTIYFPRFLGPQGMYFTTVTAWVTSLILIGIAYPIRFRRCERECTAKA